eukprot:scpid52392/ scgid2984/ Regulator of nonsense transcripts 3B; Nonsense mRNA reducing factor 3B; Up-frameshift suppressor 3 homolog B; Up-frameshift suppressor 3 homolog on chromosome X
MAKAKKSSDVVLSRRAAKELTQTRVIFRRLPPATTESELRERLKDAPEHEFLYFCKSDRSLEPFAFCRAYINLKRPEDAVRVRELMDGQLWKDSTGRECPVVVEFAPYQKVARRTRKKTDPKMGSLCDDPEYVAFLKTLETEEEPPPPPEALAEEDDQKQKEEEELKKHTPLIEFIRQRHTSRPPPTRASAAATGKTAKPAEKHAPASTSKAAARPAGGRPTTSAKEKKSEASSGGKSTKDSQPSRSHSKEDYEEHPAPEKGKSSSRPPNSKPAATSGESSSSSGKHSHTADASFSSHREKERGAPASRHAGDSRGKTRASGGSSSSKGQEHTGSSQGKRGETSSSSSSSAGSSSRAWRVPPVVASDQRRHVLQAQMTIELASSAKLQHLPELLTVDRTPVDSDEGDKRDELVTAARYHRDKLGHGGFARADVVSTSLH